jgi:hypothetical protein
MASRRRGQQEQHCGRVEQDAHDEHEPAQDVLIASAEQRRQIPDGPDPRSLLAVSQRPWEG